MGCYKQNTVCEWKTNIIYSRTSTLMSVVSLLSLKGSCLSLSVVLNSDYVPLLPCVAYVLPPPLRFFFLSLNLHKQNSFGCIFN